MLPPNSFATHQQLTSIEHSVLSILMDGLIADPGQASELFDLVSSSKDSKSLAFQYLIGELKLSAFSDQEMLKFTIAKMKRALV